MHIPDNLHQNPNGLHFIKKKKKLASKAEITW